jgi:hypothetical protein
MEIQGQKNKNLITKGALMSTTTQKLFNLAINPYQQPSVKTESNFSLKAKAYSVYSK